MRNRRLCNSVSIHFFAACTAFCNHAFNPLFLPSLVGNGMQYPGRVYSRAVIMIWPKAHRTDVQIQSRGGRAIIEGAK